MSTTPPRRRGAPPGNRNALKHGFYARRFAPTDLAGLEDGPLPGLQDEIVLLRVFIRRTIELAGVVEDLPQAVELLRVLCLASASLTRLIRTQQLLASGQSSAALDASFRQAIEEVTRELAAAAPPAP